MDPATTDDTDAIPRKKIKVMLGPCKFAGKCKCSCSTGSFVSSTSQPIRKDTMCEDCGHLISLHEDFEEERDDSSDDLIMVSNPEKKTKNESAILNSQTVVESTTPTESFAPVTLEEGIKNESSTLNSHTAIESSTLSPTSSFASVIPEGRSDFTCPRQETVARIAKGLRRNRALLIWGGPSTGKTILAHLLGKHLEEQGKLAIYISNMYLDERYNTSTFDWQSFLWKFFHPCYPSKSSIEKKIEGEVYFIIDEAECTWETSSSFWTKIFIPYLWETSGPRFCFFGRGPPNEASSAVKAVSSIEIWEESFRRSTSRINLYYSWSELVDVTIGYCSHEQTAIDLSKPARRYLYELTNGHPKLVPSCLAVVDDIFGEAAYQPQGQSLRRKVTLGAIKKILEDNEIVFGRSEMGYDMGGPPPPSSEDDRNAAINLFHALLAEWQIPYSRRTWGKCS